MTTKDPTGLVVNDQRIRPWDFGCWDEDGRKVTCDRPPGQDQFGADCCTYHAQWMRIAGDNAMVAWVEPAEDNPGAYEGYAWDPSLEDHVELCSKVGDEFIDPHDAKAAVDAALFQYVEAHLKAS